MSPVHIDWLALVLILYAVATFAQSSSKYLKAGSHCKISVQLKDGLVCGVHRSAENGTQFASFLGLPYAKQPVGERRFSELEPMEPWDGLYDASVEGPACPQHDVLYGPLLGSSGMSEACIHANIHVPLHALPDYQLPRIKRQPQPPYQSSLSERSETGLPILVYIHGGGFAFGSGSTALHGPEYLIPRDVIVITFNYRLNVFGFLTLNSSSIPGNNGLRDIITLLKWVQVNAESFGGNPKNVTLGGQSAGASSAHILSLSAAAKGLFKSVILMSGVSTGFFTTSPAYSELVSNIFLSALGINTTNPDEIHKQLISMPLDDIMAANKQVQDNFGIVVFTPVVESHFAGVTTVLDEDPEVLMANGSGNNIPFLIGFTNAECESFRYNFEKLDILNKLKENPLLILSLNLIYRRPINELLNSALRVQNTYFDGEPTIDKYINSCSDTFYVYPAMKLSETRAFTPYSAPVFLYQYSYNADFSVIKESKGLKFEGAGHMEDLTFVFKANAMEDVKGFSPRTHRDQRMINLMTKFVKHFVDYCDPVYTEMPTLDWPPVDEKTPMLYLNIESPMYINLMGPTKGQIEMVRLFDSLQNSTS